MDEPDRLIEKAREQAEGLEARVQKYRSDPENYFTTHEALDIEEAEAWLWNTLCDALQAAIEREARLRQIAQDDRLSEFKKYHQMRAELARGLGF